jgi:hypothetical protein
MAASKISELTAITAAETATGDLLAVADVSATATKKITRDELITAVLNNATSVTSALAAADTASADLFLAYDASAAAMKDITRDDLITMVANNATGLTSALTSADTAADDLFLAFDTSAAVLKDITRTELIDMVANNLAAQSVANAALQNALVATTSIKVTSSGTACTKLLSATATLDFGSINAAASADLTVAVVGAAVGDAVHLGLPAAPTAGIVFQGFVSAADVVTIRATNITAAPVDPASASYRVAVLGF